MLMGFLQLGLTLTPRRKRGYVDGGDVMPDLTWEFTNGNIQAGDTVYIPVN